MLIGSIIMKIRNIVILTTLLFAQPAKAEEEDRKVIYKQKTEIDFEGLNVDAALVKPAGSFILERKQASFNPLIKLRTNFNEEIDKSTDEIK
jgi:hypothetical protein